MVIVFQNLFGQGYEGGANWLEVSLHSLGLLSQPPLCIVLGASQEVLPTSIRNSDHIKAIPFQTANTSGTTRILGSITRRLTGQHWEAQAVKDVAAKYKVDLWVGFSGFEGLGPQRLLLVWYPDFQFRHLPDVFSEQEIIDRNRQWKYVAERADGILVISEAVANDALKEDSHVAAKLKVCAFPPVLPMSVLTASPDETRRKYDLPQDFFLVCNQFFKHKNHITVLQSLKQLQDSDHPPPVVAFTGRPHDYRNPDFFSELLQFVQVHRLHQYCRFLGVLPRHEQLALIRAATAVIHPSQFEGRGAIVEEAHVLGTQVICSDLPVHRELRAPGTLFFPIGDVSALAVLMKKDLRRSEKSAEEIAEESKRMCVVYGHELIDVFNGLIKRQARPAAAI